MECKICLGRFGIKCVGDIDSPNGRYSFLPQMVDNPQPINSCPILTANEDKPVNGLRVLEMLQSNVIGLDIVDTGGRGSGFIWKVRTPQTAQ